MSKLKHCPFCGGEAIKSAFSWGNITDEYTIQCSVCGVRTSVLKSEDAINVWNTRTPMDNIVEKLEELPYGRSYHDYAEKGIVHKYLERNDVLDIVKQEINNGLE